MFLKDTNQVSRFLDTMKRILYESPKMVGDKPYKLNKAKFMIPLAKVVIKLIYGCIQPRESGKDSII
jgi:hypothetical protein